VRVGARVCASCECDTRPATGVDAPEFSLFFIRGFVSSSPPIRFFRLISFVLARRRRYLVDGDTMYIPRYKSITPRRHTETLCIGSPRLAE